MYCPNCGEKSESGEKHCTNCGNKLKNSGREESVKNNNKEPKSSTVLLSGKKKYVY